MIVLEIHVDLPSRLTEEPCILVLLYVGLVIDDTDRWLVVVVDRDGGVGSNCLDRETLCY